MLRFCIALFAGIFVLDGPTYAQTTLHGMVADSATMLPLPNINIRSKAGRQITVSDIRGHFEIMVMETDTLTFSSVGYHSKKFSVKELRETGIVFMMEEHKTLNTVEINDVVLPPYLKKLPPESPWQNPTQNQKSLETPGFQGVQTFGPGYVMKGPISRFSKYEKERKKLKNVQKQNYEAKDYVSIVNSPEVKDRIIADYNLTEKEYYDLLAIFNEKNKDIIYQLEANELISILLMFYGENAKRK